MATNNAQVNFVYITRAKYNSATKNANTIYIVKETNNEEALYLGAKLLNKNYVDTAIVADSSKLGGQLPNYYLTYSNLTGKPVSLKNPYSLIIQQDGVNLGTYNGSSTKIIKIPSSSGGGGIKKWEHLGTVPHSQGALSYYPTSGDFSEYMVVYTDNPYGIPSGMTEVLYGPPSLVSGMSLPGYMESGISCNSGGINIEWNSGGSADAKSYVIVYGR